MIYRPAYEKGKPEVTHAVPGEGGSVRAVLHDGITHFVAETLCGRIGWKVYWEQDFAEGEIICPECIARFKAGS